MTTNEDVDDKDNDKYEDDDPKIKYTYIYECTFCKRHYTNIPKLLIHRHTHTTMKTYCKICKERFKNTIEMYKHDMTNHPERKYKYHKTKYKPTTPTSTPTNTIRPDGTKNTLSSNDDNTNDTLSTNDDKQDPLRDEPTTTDPPDPKHDINDRNLSSDRPDVVSDPPVNKNNNDIKHDPPEIGSNKSKSEIIVENINSN